MNDVLSEKQQEAIEAPLHEDEAKVLFRHWVRKKIENQRLVKHYGCFDWKYNAELNYRGARAAAALDQESIDEIEAEVLNEFRRFDGDRQWNRSNLDPEKYDLEEESDVRHPLTPQYAGNHLATLAVAVFPEMPAEELACALFFAGVEVAEARKKSPECEHVWSPKPNDVEPIRGCAHVPMDHCTECGALRAHWDDTPPDPKPKDSAMRAAPDDPF